MAKIYDFSMRKGVKRMDKITVFDVAETFLSFKPMTHKKLQKLCYYAYAWYLTICRSRLFSEKFEAWIHGPVCPELYYEFKNYGAYNIEKNCCVPSKISKNANVYSFLDKIFKLYGEMTADELEALTHNEIPWINARKGLNRFDRASRVIQDEDMTDFYSKLLNN